MKTTAKEYYDALGFAAGTLFYLTRKNGSTEEYVLTCILIGNLYCEVLLQQTHGIIIDTDKHTESQPQPQLRQKKTFSKTK